MHNANLQLLSRLLVAGELVTRGARCVEEFTAQHRRMLRARNASGELVELIVKARRAGTWQASTNDGNPGKASPSVFWIFVDLEGGAEAPRYFIAPDVWVRKDIEAHHQAYLERHGGQRAISKDSTHHALQPHRLTPWEDRWDQLRLNP
jgi:hypothetical protein